VYMKTTTLAIIAIVTAMVLITASTFSSPALAVSGDTSKKKKGGSDTNTNTNGGSSTSSSSTKGTKSTSSSTSGGTSTSTSTSSVSKQLKALISCLTTASKTTGTMPTKAQFATCESQSSFGTVGGSTIGGSATGGGSTTSGAKTTGGGLTPSTTGGG
jgi:hypothetical protein